ncbi:uncharacterized protein LOC131319654 [Rhododendron vialii]|uniref:uncharacterized protein LOC131319654 n=1 Tax=Rhododendron vialii TaxID=182163 RepID=UPI00265EDFEB|nr:uncharacterized protein LOC131319654 [Rhododendron vialii]XP_058206003.1 uncharacterized protein LOC131319654 [Rhododendron vialii]
MADILPESSDWAFLPAHLLDSIAEKLVHLPDFLAFSVVCKHWFYAATFDNQQKRQHRAFLGHRQIPMLVVPSSNPRDKDSNGENPEKTQPLRYYPGWIFMLAMVKETVDPSILMLALVCFEGGRVVMS